MRVICPYTRIEPETRAALNLSGYEWEPADVSGSDTAYTALLQSAWVARLPFALVEHDIVPWDGALAELEECPQPWCAFEYPWRDRMHAGLGCARFSRGLLAAIPGAVEATLAESSEAHPPGHWCNLDDRLMRVLTRAGVAKHVHGPPVGHLRLESLHACS